MLLHHVMLKFRFKMHTIGFNHDKSWQ